MRRVIEVETSDGQTSDIRLYRCRLRDIFIMRPRAATGQALSIGRGWPRRGRVMGHECEDCRGATPIKPSFERRWRGAPEDRMPRRGITTAIPHRRKNDVFAQRGALLSQEAMRQGAFYLPPLRGTFLQRKACRCVAPRHFLNAPSASHHPALRATFLRQGRLNRRRL